MGGLLNVQQRVGGDVGDVLVGQPVPHLPAVALSDNEPRCAQCLQVLGNQWLRDPECVHQLVHTPWPGAEQVDDRESHWSTESPEQLGRAFEGGQSDVRWRVSRRRPVAHRAQPLQVPTISRVCAMSVNPAFLVTLANHCSTSGPASSTVREQQRQIRWW